MKATPTEAQPLGALRGATPPAHRSNRLGGQIKHIINREPRDVDRPCVLAGDAGPVIGAAPADRVVADQGHRDDELTLDGGARAAGEVGGHGRGDAAGEGQRARVR